MRPKPCRLARHAELRWRVAQKLALQWSPEQISGWLKRRIPCRPRHAGLSRNDLSQPLCSDARRAEEGADGAPAHGAADAPGQGRHARRADWDRSSMRSRSANGRPRSRTAPCQATGKAIFSPERTTRTSRRWSSAIRASRCSSRSRARTRRPWSTRSPSTCAGCPQQLRRSLTWDRGKEMADHKRFTLATDVQGLLL